MKKYSAEGIDLIKKLMIVDPKKRLTSRDALNHPWFKMFSRHRKVSEEI